MNTDNNGTDSILEVREITRNFGGLIAVNKVSFSVNKGEIFGVIGPNGAGKTTLFNTITGLILPTSGNLLYQGKKLIKQKPHQIARKGIARTFQNLRLFESLSALENVAIAHHLHDRTDLFSGILGLPKIRIQQQQTYSQALKLLELVGMASKAEQQACNLAYGDRRRLEIARALALKPQVLLLDEPAAGMNTNEKGSLSELIKQIRDDFNLTILLIEHHVPLVMGLCDRIAVLDFGQLIALGKAEKVRNDPAVIEAYLGSE
jgi:branched-chain amino acid transport system ATP-binding protein